MKAFSWKCPFCDHNASIKSDNIHHVNSVFSLDNFEGDKEFYAYFIVCPNEECKKFTLNVKLFKTSYSYVTSKRTTGVLTNEWQLIPQSNAKVFPSYIPKVIVDDYSEACSILQLSPKASATLARRCLQGMIRDFFKIKKGRLIDEINAIKESIDPLTWKSIDAVRKIGNIGAHMEKDINFIIDVDPKEAGILLQLIEQLIQDWYINRHERELRLSTIIDISEGKDKQKKDKK